MDSGLAADAATRNDKAELIIRKPYHSAGSEAGLATALLRHQKRRARTVRSLRMRRKASQVPVTETASPPSIRVRTTASQSGRARSQAKKSMWWSPLNSQRRKRPVESARCRELPV